MTGLPTSSGRSSSSTEAKKASMSTCMMWAAGSSTGSALTCRPVPSCLLTSPSCHPPPTVGRMPWARASDGANLRAPAPEDRGGRSWRSGSDAFASEDQTPDEQDDDRASDREQPGLKRPELFDRHPEEHR